MASTVQTRHPDYDDKEYEWRQMRDTIAGPSAIKRSGTLYLPMPSAMAVNPDTTAGTSSNRGVEIGRGNGSVQLENKTPWAHNNKAYAAYVQRARFPDITATTKMGLLGIATKNKPFVEMPESLGHLVENATNTGMTMTELFKFLVDEVISVGRVTLLVDVDENSQPYFVVQIAESFINWKNKAPGSRPSLAVFESKLYGENDESDMFSQDESEAHLACFLNEEGQYVAQNYIDGAAVGDVIEPSIQGNRLKYVPTVTINSTDCGNAVETSPLVGISDVAIAIYQKEADMANAEFVTCNPMLVFIGIDKRDAPSVVGSNVAFTIPDPEGDAKYVEPNANCLEFVKSHIDSLLAEAATYGASLLGGSNNVSESTETTRMKQEASGASLKTIVDTVEKGIRNGIQIMLDWMQQSDQEFKFNASKEFSDLKLTSAEIRELVAAWLQKGISHQTFFENMQKAGYVNEDRSFEDEVQIIIEEQQGEIEQMRLQNQSGDNQDNQEQNQDDQQENVEEQQE